MIDDRLGCSSSKPGSSRHVTADSAYRFSPLGTASDTSARAALAQSTSFCTVGAPVTQIAAAIAPSTLMGNPPPYAATRASVGMPAKSDGSPWIKLQKVLRGDAEQSCIRLILRNLDGKDRGPIHPAECLELAPVIENRYVLANATFSGFRHRFIHHFLC